MPRRFPLRATAAAATLAMASVGAVASAAPVAPPTPFETTPPSLNFGTVMVNEGVTKPVKMINRTPRTLYYAGADWPNFQNPSGWEFPYGFWNMSYDPYPCYEIAPRSSCTLMFQFMPYSAGKRTSYFAPRYADASSTYTDTTSMRGVGVSPPS